MLLLEMDFGKTNKFYIELPNILYVTRHSQIFILLASIFTSWIFGTGDIYKILAFCYVEGLSVYTIDIKHFHSMID